MIIKNDESLLRVKCEPVKPEEVDFLRIKLEEELKASAKRGFPGLGLAAPQIGIPKTMAIVRIDRGLKIDLVNCRLGNRYDKFIFENEGCLSFPNRYVKTERFNQVFVVENMVEPYNFLATGLASVVIQHEIDHWFGCLLPDLDIKNMGSMHSSI